MPQLLLPFSSGDHPGYSLGSSSQLILPRLCWAGKGDSGLPAVLLLLHAEQVVLPPVLVGSLSWAGCLLSPGQRLKQQMGLIRSPPNSTLCPSFPPGLPLSLSTCYSLYLVPGWPSLLVSACWDMWLCGPAGWSCQHPLLYSWRQMSQAGFWASVCPLRLLK